MYNLTYNYCYRQTAVDYYNDDNENYCTYTCIILLFKFSLYIVKSQILLLETFY